MGSTWTKVFCIVLYCLPLLGLNLSSQPDPGFQFNCWDQTCSFPHQYCDLDEKRCLFCSDDLCESKDFPLQCRSYCQGVKLTYSVPESSTNSTKGIHNFEDMPGGIETALWLIFGVLLIILVVIGVLVVMFCRSKHNIQRQYKYITNPTETDELTHTVRVQSDNDDHLKRSDLVLILNEKESLSTRNMSQPDSQISMSSGGSPTSSITQPEEDGHSRQHEHHIETELLKNSYGEDRTIASDDDSGFTEERRSTRPVKPSPDFPSLQKSEFQEDTSLKQLTLSKLIDN
ncbi:uncharacterized protein LOC133190376 [Saccostrea echinata]|uniref:uncharacterized protein LOC133190376 n=1 Tax=Saccostrea echinata TaxID=191078 RepID=UPI002A80E1F2|nr:uncharacterized protein LOC133190376 [Saccostrea echinata]